MRREHTQPREREHRTSSASSGLMGDSEGDAAGKLFVGGVSWQTTEIGLREHFGKYGELTDAALMRNKHTGQPRGFGFVKFKDSASADRVMAEVHVLDGRTVDVKKAVPRDKSAPLGTDSSIDGDAASEASSTRPESSSSSSSSSHSSSSSMTGSGNKTSSSRAGSSGVASSATTSRSSKPPAWKTLGGSPPSVTSAAGINGGGVVAKLPAKQSVGATNSSHNSSDRQSSEQSNGTVAPSPRSSAVIPPHSRPEQLRKIFVGGLAPSVTDTDFRQYFEQFGNISDAVVMFDRQTQRSRGFGFITFETSDSLEAVLDLDKHEIKGKVVEVKRAEPKEPVRASEDSGAGGAGGGGRGGESLEEEGVIQEYSHMTYGALSLQESCPIPGTGAMGMVFGVHYQHYDDGRGYGIYVPGIPYPTPGGVVAVPMGCGLGVNASPFTFAPMPPAYYGSINDSSLQVPPSFDYERAWHGGDFSMDEQFNATGYGSFRGQAATHGRLRRKYRPY